MSLTDDTADAIILRWPGKQQVAPKPTRRHRFDWLAFPVWVARLVAECLGWVSVLGLLTSWL